MSSAVEEKEEAPPTPVIGKSSVSQGDNWSSDLKEESFPIGRLVMHCVGRDGDGNTNVTMRFFDDANNRRLYFDLDLEKLVKEAKALRSLYDVADLLDEREPKKIKLVVDDDESNNKE